MKTPHTLIALLCAAGLAGCAHTSTPASGAAAVAPASEHAPTPFTAAQIRGASADGREWVFLLEGLGKPAMHLRMKMSAVGDEGVAMTRSIADASTGEALGEEDTNTSTWPELVAHAEYPVGSTTVEDDTIEVPAGQFDAIHYTVTEEADGEKTVTEAWFARTLPGPPVLMWVHVDGTQVTSMTLLKHTPGAAP